MSPQPEPPPPASRALGASPPRPRFCPLGSSVSDRQALRFRTSVPLLQNPLLGSPLPPVFPPFKAPRKRLLRAASSNLCGDAPSSEPLKSRVLSLTTEREQSCAGRRVWAPGPAWVPPRGWLVPKPAAQLPRRWVCSRGSRPAAQGAPRTPPLLRAIGGFRLILRRSPSPSFLYLLKKKKITSRMNFVRPLKPFVDGDGA